jgi:hypothetical protein
MLHSAALGNLPGVSKLRLRALFDIVNELRRALHRAAAALGFAANRLHGEMEAVVALASMRGHTEYPAQVDFVAPNRRCGYATGSRQIGLASRA